MTGKRFCERGALERFFLLGEIYRKAEELVDQANNYQVDDVIIGIEDFLKTEGVQYGNFVNSLRAKAKARHAKQTADVRRVTELLATLK